jgi:NAD(P)-dependent dehydrogenase (short-subunit alcohol dehydrogenase family)
MSLPTRILVTGGGTGLGKAIAAACVKAGAQVVICGRRQTLLAEAAREIGAEATPLDIRETLPDDLGAFDGLVHAAGARVHASVSHWDPSDAQDLWDLHVGALARLSARLTPGAHGGSILALSSTLALSPVEGSAIYSTTKAAQLALVRSLALEGAGQRVRANSLVLGVVPTDMTRSAPEGTEDLRLEALARLHPLGLGHPDDVAAAAVSLLSNPWITGAELLADGGLSLNPQP